MPAVKVLKESQAALKLVMVAGEASGDLLASMLLRGMHQHWSDIHAQGIGGLAMQQQGFQTLWPAEYLSVHGYSAEVFKRVVKLLRIRSQLAQICLRDKTNLFIGVDAPDFNLTLEKRLRANGIPTVQFVCPSIWAWRPERIHSLRAAVNHVLCLYPFEPDLLERYGVEATFVGHPLANCIPLITNMQAARASLNLQSDGPVIAILPGSRNKEIDYLLPRFLAAAQILHALQPNLQMVLPSVSEQMQRVQTILRNHPLRHNVQVLCGQSHAALAACDVTLIASGTATLEAALYKKPMVISYAMHPWSYKFMKRKQLQPWVGLPNILLQESVVPEILQEAATPQALAEAAWQWMQEAQSQSLRWQQLKKKFIGLHQSLQADTTTISAHVIKKMLNR